MRSTAIQEDLIALALKNSEAIDYVVDYPSKRINALPLTSLPRRHKTQFLCCCSGTSAGVTKNTAAD